MLFPWNDEKCIVCKLTTEERRTRCAGTAEFTKEHLIPEAIGGKLQCSFLCKHCNSQLGVLEANLKSDATIRLCIENLRGELPDLWNTISEGQAYIVQDPGGSLRAKLKDGEIRVDSWKGEDGSVIGPVDKAWPAIHKMLLRQQSSESEIAEAKRKFEAIPEGGRSEVAPGIDALKRTADKIYPSLKLEDIDIACLKIAYEYLALHLRRGIFNEYFDAVRSALLSGGPLPDRCRVNPLRLKDSRCQAFHCLRARNTDTGLLVKVLLFGYLSCRIEFLRVQRPTDAIWHYTLDLVTGNEEWA